MPVGGIFCSRSRPSRRSRTARGVSNLQMLSFATSSWSSYRHGLSYLGFLGRPHARTWRERNECSAGESFSEEGVACSFGVGSVKTCFSVGCLQRCNSCNPYRALTCLRCLDVDVHPCSNRKYDPEISKAAFKLNDSTRHCYTFPRCHSMLNFRPAPPHIEGKSCSSSSR